MKVCMYPTPDEIESNHGIGRIVHAMYRYLPAYGIEFVDEPHEVDVVATHTQMFDFLSVDVLHLHGAYWTGDPKSGQYYSMHHYANRRIVEGVRQARVVTVPSRWCTEVFKRDMRITPLVVGHGIDFAEWPVSESLGYVLWNKNRNEDVCDPTPAWEMAQRGVQTVSTFLPQGIDPPPAMTVTGAMPHDKMKILVAAAGVYLATVKETYGIGTLEAMACGVPVLGYNHGGTADIVQHGVTGYLVKPGDIDGLMVGYDYILKHRAEMSRAAREYAETRDWSKVIGQYAEVYEQARRQAVRPVRTSVVITNYNYGQYVSRAIESVVRQTTPAEIVVVDDGSTDDSKEVIRQTPAPNHVLQVIYQENQGVAAARNAGIARATGEYIICLDADDMLDERYVGTLENAMDADRGLGVAYTGLGLINEQLDRIDPNPGWPPEFSWESQSSVSVPPSNTIPCAAMFRKSMWERAGGYKQEYAPGEDTEFFTRGLSVGFAARRVASEPLFFYRAHEGSASRTKQYIAIDAFHPWMRDKLYPIGAPSEKMPLVMSYSSPAVSVIIPVGLGHNKFLPNALDSLLGQTMRNWEVIVVWDDVPQLALKRTYPFVREFYGQGIGSGSCRNVGLEQARAPLSVFLDADDWLMPDALAEMCRAYGESEGRYIYTDWIAVHGSGPSLETVPDYNPIDVVTVPQHAVTVLIGTEAARAVRFSETLRYLEDWDFFARCAIAGVQGRRLDKPLVAVRIHKERKTTEWTSSENDREKTFRTVAMQFADYAKGEKPMGSCCGGNGDSVIAAKIAAGYMPAPPEETPLGQQAPDVVRVQFVGAATASQTYGGPGIVPSGRRYRGANNPLERMVDADPRDVPWLENSGDWKRVASPSRQVAPVQLDTIMQVLSRTQTVAPQMEPQDSPVTPVPEKSVPEPEPERDSGIMLAKRPRKAKKAVAVSNDPN